MTDKEQKCFDMFAAELDKCWDGKAWRKDCAIVRKLQKTAKLAAKNEGRK